MTFKPILRATCLLAALLTTIGCNVCGAARKGFKQGYDNARFGIPLKKPKGFVGIPFFGLGNLDYHGGLTVLADVDGERVLLSNLSLLGPMLSLPKAIPPSKVSTEVARFGLYRELPDNTPQTPLAGEFLAISSANPKATHSAGPGDILAFAPKGMPNTATPFKVNEAPLTRATHVYVLWDEINGKHHRQGPGVLHGLGIVGKDRLLGVVLDSKVDMTNAVGAPLVNQAGELVGITMGYVKARNVLVANPASRFMPEVRKQVRLRKAFRKKVEALHRSPPTLKEPKIGIPSPIHTISGKDYAGGASSLVNVGKKQVILSAYHLLGPSVGAPKLAPGANIPKTVSAWSYEAPNGRKLKVAGAFAPMAGATELGETAKGPGDILAFVPKIPPRLFGKPLTIRRKSLIFPAHVYLLWWGVPNQLGKKHGRLVHGVAIKEKTGMVIVEPEKRLKLGGSSGAPVLDENGQLVGVQLGGLGGNWFVNPVTRFLPELERSLSKMQGQQ